MERKSDQELGKAAPGLDEASGSFHLSGCGSIQGQWCGRGASQDVGNVRCWWGGGVSDLGSAERPPSGDAGSAAGAVGGTRSQGRHH